MYEKPSEYWYEYFLNNPDFKSNKECYLIEY